MNRATGDIRLTCLSNEAAIRGLLGRVMPLLPNWGVTPEDVSTFEMVLAEALNNISEHAFPDTNDAFIAIRICAKNDALEVTLHDTGAPMPGLKLPEGALPSSDVAREALPEGGFGWFLIKAHTSHLSYRRTAGGNHLEFSIRLEQSTQPSREGCCRIANGG